MITPHLFALPVNCPPFNYLASNYRYPLPLRLSPAGERLSRERDGKVMSINSYNSIAAGVSRTASFSRAHAAHTTTHTAKHAYKHAWPTATKSAFYANFYAVDEATGATIG